MIINKYIQKFGTLEVGCKKYSTFAKKCSFAFLNPYFQKPP